MQALINAIAKAFIGALPTLVGALYSKVLKPLIERLIEYIKHEREKYQHKKTAKRLKNAKTKEESDDSFGDMP